jgi:large subunit ribosomal protein L23
MKSLLIVPRMSEKTYKLSIERNTYVFNIPLTMNRVEAAKIVKAQYGVDVLSVKIVIAKGKAVRFVRKGGRVNTGVHADVKKAYVRLAAGQTLPIFAAVEESEQADTKEAKKSDNTVVEQSAKRGLFGRKNEKSKSATTQTKVTRTQAKVGEK